MNTFGKSHPLAWIAAAACVAAVLITAAVSGQSREIAGTYVLDEAQSAADDAARTAAIEAAAKLLPEDARDGLQARLDVMTRAAPRIELQRSGTDMVVTAGDAVELRSGLDGTRESIKGDLALEQRMEAGALVQTIEGDNLRGKVSKSPIVQTRRYVRGERGTMTLETTLEGGDLVEPLVVRARYQAR